MKNLKVGDYVGLYNSEGEMFDLVQLDEYSFTKSYLEVKSTRFSLSTGKKLADMPINTWDNYYPPQLRQSYAANRKYVKYSDVTAYIKPFDTSNFYQLPAKLALSHIYSDICDVHNIHTWGDFKHAINAIEIPDDAPVNGDDVVQYSVTESLDNYVFRTYIGPKIEELKQQEVNSSSLAKIEEHEQAIAKLKEKIRNDA
jgi:hypothetical protein